MATFQEVIGKALNDGTMKMVSVNQNMMELARGTKKKPPFVKTAVPEELVDGLMRRERVAFILHMDGDEMNALAKLIDRESQTTDSTESA